MDWLEMRIYHSSNQDGLIASIEQALISLGPRAHHRLPRFFLRYWEGGPHIRFRILTPSDLFNSLPADLSEAAGEHFVAHPSKDWPSQSQYESVASYLAGLEKKRWFMPALRPPDSIEVVSFSGRVLPDLTDRQTQYLINHYIVSSEVAATRLTHPLSQRRNIGLVCILLAHCAPGMTACEVLEQFRWSSVSVSTPGAVPQEPLKTLVQQELGVLLGRRFDLGRVSAVLPKGLEEWVESLSPIRESFGGSPKEAIRILDHCAHLTCNRLGILLHDEGALRGLLLDSLIRRCAFAGCEIP